MADNVVTSAAIGTGITLAADDISSVFYQRVKLSLGADGSAVDAVAGAGVVGTGVQRVTLASDDPAVTSLALLDNVIYVDDAAWTGDTSSHALVGGIYQSTPQTITDGRTGPILLDANGKIQVATHAVTQSGTWNVGTVTTITNVVHVDDNSGSLTVDNAGTFAVQATIAAGATAIAKAEDVASADADVGVPAMAVRKATPANTSGTDGDYEFLQMSAGRLWASATIDAALPAGTNAIGKLAANSGVDIGDTDVTSVIPGTGATNLGKAIDSVVGATDTGVALLAKHQEDSVAISTASGDYDVLHIDSRGALVSNIEQHHVFDTFNATTGWTALGNDTLNLATTAKHLVGTAALTFDKVNGAANTVFAGIQKTLSSVNLGEVSMHDLIQFALYLPTITDVAYVFVRLGTDSSNYNEWRLADTTLTAATFLTASVVVGDASYAGITGNGWDPAAVTYIAVGVAFDAETNTLAGIVFDEVSYHTNTHTSASLGVEVTSDVNTPNVNINRVGGTATATGSGTVSAGTQRVTLATDVALPAGTNLIGRLKPEGDEYETVAASQTAQVLGATGGTGDYIAGVLVIPATTSPGNVILLDNATSITIFTGGASSVSNLVPFLIPLGMTSVSGAWKITTGSNVSCIGIGNFT